MAAASSAEIADSEATVLLQEQSVVPLAELVSPDDALHLLDNEDSDSLPKQQEQSVAQLAELVSPDDALHLLDNEDSDSSPKQLEWYARVALAYYERMVRIRLNALAELAKMPNPTLQNPDRIDIVPVPTFADVFALHTILARSRLCDWLLNE